MSNVNALLAAVAKLSGADNYYDWAFQMQLIMMCSGCWGVVNGSVSRPCHTDLACLEDWNAKSADGYTAIGLTLNPDQTIHIRNCADAPSAWSALKQLYSRNSAANQIAIKQRMQNTRLAPGDTVGDYLNTITTYANQLQSMGITVSDQDITDILLANLPPSYDSVATALIIHHGRPTISEVSAALLEYEMQLKEGELDYRITANVAKSGHGKPSGVKTPADSKSANSKPADDTKKGNHCYRCQQPGHFARDCMAPAPVHAETATVAVANSKSIELF